MIYLTGDTHGDLSRFQKGGIKRLKRGDTLIICGDFGFIWTGGKEERRRLDWLARRPYRILFVEGTHDNLAELAQYPVVDFEGAPAHQIAENLFHLIRGGIFTIEGRTLFAFGGGESPDREFRELGKTWWEEELPTPEERDLGTKNLAAQNRRVDYIVTHEAPAFVGNFINMDMPHCSSLNTYFDEISKSCTYQRWFFGCHHLDKLITQSHVAVFCDVVAL